MGATVPVFELIGRSHGTSVARLYGINIAGASLGVLLLAFWAIPALGIWRTGALVAALNLAVFAGTHFLHPRAAPAVPDAVAPRASPARLAPALAGLLAFGTGLVTFGLEVAWFRSLRASFQSVSDSFAIMLAAVLIPLAIGARLVPLVRRRGIGPGALLALAGAAILLATPLVERMDLLAPQPLAQSGVAGGYLLLVAQWLALSLAVLGPPILVLGMVLPWLLEDVADPQLAGRVYGVNTAGSVIGSLLCAWLLLPTLGFARSAWLLGCVIVGLAVLASAGRARGVAAAAGATALAVAVFSTASVGRDRIQLLEVRGEYRILAYEEGPDVTVSVVEFEDRSRSLVIDGFVASAEGQEGTRYMEWMGRLPMILHPHPRDALVIAFGTGQTANALREEGPERLDVVDLSRAVLELAPWFTSNDRVLEDPRVHPVVMDGRAWLRRSERRYDVVTLEPMPPHFAGMNALYSRDFYEIIASRLRPGGIVAQWLPLHLVPPSHAPSVAAAFRAVFPDSILWLELPEAGGVLLGRRASGEAPLGSSWPGLERPVASRSLEAAAVRAAVLLDQGGLAEYTDGAAVISDDNQLLAYGRIRRLISFYGLSMALRNAREISAIADRRR